MTLKWTRINTLLGGKHVHGFVHPADREYFIAKAETDRLEAQIIQLILDAEEACGLDDLSMEVAGRKYGVAVKSYWRIPAAHKDEAFKLLREIGMGDLITERVDDRILTREINDILEANKGELPEMYGGLHLEGYDKTTLTNRKA